MDDTMLKKILFNVPSTAGRELEYITQVLGSGHMAGDGAFTKKCHHLLEDILGVPKVLLTTSCTHALEMSGFLLNLQAGDEFIVPSFTFVSTVNAFMVRGAKPVFIDIRPDTLNMDEAQLEGLITSRTKAIVPVHYAGVGCKMDVIMDVANRHGIPVVEDNAHGLFGKYQGQYLGTFGSLATQSFHETKNFTCGEGGALLINDPRLVERAEIIREKGTDRSRFFRGEVDKYGWVDIGSSYLPSEILAAILFSQLEMHEQIQAKRKMIWDYYSEHLSDWAVEHGILLPSLPDDCDQSYHMFYMLLPSLKHRVKLIQHLKSKGIHSVFHYLPLHISKMGRKNGGREGDCPVTESVSDRLLRLPFHNQLTEADLAQVVHEIKLFDL